jgi:hypothetical protein
MEFIHGARASRSRILHAIASTSPGTEQIRRGNKGQDMRSQESGVRSTRWPIECAGVTAVKEHETELHMKTTFVITSSCASVVGLLLIAGIPAAAAEQPQDGSNNRPERLQFVYVSGQVNIPGRYVYTNGLTVGTTIKMAKGLTSEAAPAQGRIVRGDKKPVTFDLDAIEKGKIKDVPLQPGDKVHVPAAHPR